jgi:subtilisin family serine protease
MIWLTMSGIFVYENGDSFLVSCDKVQREVIECESGSRQNLLKVMIIGRGDPSSIHGLMRSGFASRFSSGFAVVGYISASNLARVSAMKNVVKILPDFRIYYDEKARLEVDNSKPQTDMFRIRELTGASQTNLKLGLNGSGVTVAIVDTGVDFGNPDISSAVARDSEGRPIAIDADEQGLVMTNTTFRARIDWVRNESLIRSTSDVAISSEGILLNLCRGGLGTDVKYWNGTDISTVHLTQNYKIGRDSRRFIVSKSGVYHFGLLMEKDSFEGPGDEGILYPVLVVDSQIAGIYDTVYMDLSSTYALWTGQGEADHSFYDENPHHVGDGSEFLVSDFTGDGLPDISAGMLGAQILDVWGIFKNRTSEYDLVLGFPRGTLLPGLDSEGDFLGVMFDFEPHGTLCAANVASRGTVGYDVYNNGTLYKLPGIAPTSSILAAKALWLGDVFYTWMWVSGFDLDVKSGEWLYTGQHRAEIVSNSWGWSEWPLLGAGVGYDLLSILENALSIHGYLSSEYPGTLFVHAVGNGGPGYGTMTSSGFGSFALSVGASTSLHWASSLGVERMGAYSNSGDDIIAWSCRGPNALGQSKPDLLNVGAFAFDAGPVNGGYGNGSRAYDIFGGTSEAAPLTAGAAAIVIEGLRKKGKAFDPSFVKTTLMSTAKDLGNDPFVQGSGRVDVYGAAIYAVGNCVEDSSPFRVSTNATYRNVMSSLSDAWTMLDVTLPNATSVRTRSQVTFEDTAWYAGTVSQGNSTSATFVVDNPSNSKLDLSVGSSVLRLVASYSYSNMSDPSLRGVPAYFNLTEIVGPIPDDTTLMIVRLDYPFESFYNKTVTPYGYPSNLLYLYAYDWEDTNLNGKVEWNETALVNYGYNWGNSQEIRVSHPTQKMKHEKVIGVWEATPLYMLSSGHETAEETYVYKPVNFTLNIYCFKEAPWNWISTSVDHVTVEPKSSVRFTARLEVPDEELPGVYGGFLLVEHEGQQTTRIPVSVNVPLEISAFNKPLSVVTSDAPLSILYQSSSVHGAIDWRWRYESGDWRIIQLNVDIPESRPVDVTVLRVEWTSPNTSIDIYVLDPSGNITATTTPPVQWFLGIPNNWIPNTGVFYRSQNAGPHATVLAVPTTKPGFYTVILHTTLFEGRTAAEGLDATLEITSLKVEPTKLQLLDYLPHVVGLIVGVVLTVTMVGVRRKKRSNLHQNEASGAHPC